jgi:hypothetical protein
MTPQFVLDEVNTETVGIVRVDGKHSGTCQAILCIIYAQSDRRNDLLRDVFGHLFCSTSVAGTRDKINLLRYIIVEKRVLHDIGAFIPECFALAIASLEHSR